MPKPKDKIPSVPPQRYSDINDPSEPFDDYLKFNIENDNLSAAEIKDLEFFLFSNDKRCWCRRSEPFKYEKMSLLQTYFIYAKIYG